MPTLEYSVRHVDGGIEILDRRVFPHEIRWVHCDSVESVAIAIEQMVTQSCGPLFAATGGMVIAAQAAASTSASAAEARDSMRVAGQRLVRTRRTNNHIRDGVAHVLSAVDQLDDADAQSLVEVVTAAAAEAEAHYRASSDTTGEFAAALIPDGARILTHCWADLYLIGMVKALVAADRQVEFFCTETRPYLQGARLTAHTLAEMGCAPTLLTDGMPAWAMQQGLVDTVVTAADRVTMDGHIVNKVGTLQVAIAANAFDLPFHVLIPAPDRLAPSLDQVSIEMRDGNEVLHCLGQRTATPLATGMYPAFDATPPRWVTDVVTDRGVFTPDRLADYYN